MVLIDYNIVIEWLKGNASIIDNLNKIGYENICISSITKMEILQGSRNSKELKQLDSALKSVDIYHLNARVSELATELIKKFRLSHNLKIPDALIGATSMVYDLPLYTLNKKDFHFISEIQLWDV